MRHNLLLLMLLLLLPLTNWAQTPPTLDGHWIGTLTQEAGGFSEEYEFEVYLQQAEKTCQGRTYVEVPEVLGVMSFSATIRGKILYLEEDELLYSRKPAGMSWCYKKMQLRIAQRHGQWLLEGPWQGESSYGPCLPGWIKLQKVVPQA